MAGSAAPGFHDPLESTLVRIGVTSGTPEVREPEYELVTRLVAADAGDRGVSTGECERGPGVVRCGEQHIGEGAFGMAPGAIIRIPIDEDAPVEILVARSARDRGMKGIGPPFVMAAGAVD